jgi:hypothetical protein
MSDGLQAATRALSAIDGFSDGEREAIVGLVKMRRVRAGRGDEGWTPPLSSLVGRAFNWAEFDRWQAVFAAGGIFPRRWDGLQLAPASHASPAARATYGQRKLELLLEWLDMLARRAAELSHYTKQGRQVRIVRQHNDDRCPTCESSGAHEVRHGRDTMPPLHPGCRCVLMAATPLAPRERIGPPSGARRRPS